LALHEPSGELRRLDHNDLEQAVEPGEIGWIARVERELT
jgi:hypothetical protein